MLQNLFIELLITSCIGATLAGVLALIRPITQKHFSSRWHYYMWLAVLVVMMCPLRLNLPEKQPPAVSEPKQISAVQTTEQADYMVSEPISTVSQPVQSDFIYEEQQETTAEPKFSIIFDMIVGILPVLWLAVAALLFAFKLLGYGAFVSKMKRNSHITECTEIKKYTSCKIIARSSDCISSPLMIGIIKPVLLLPDGELTEEQLDNILKHEMTHFKRHDILYKWFTAFVKCVHWFNPAIYFISRQVNIDCEISCDMAVTADMNREEEISYIDTILSLVTRTNAKPVPLTTGMAGSKKILKKRFLTIRNRINTTKSARIFSRIAAIVTAAAALTASIAILSGCDLPNNTGTASAAEPINCLVAGTDEDGRIDTILLVSTDFENATVISIPRDTKDIKEKYPSGLTGGNVEELQKIISNMLKIDIDKYVVIDLDTALKALSEIDGLELSIPDLYNDGVGMVYDDEYKDLHISLNPGEHALSAKEMLDYMRYVKRNPEYYLNGGDTSQDGGRLGRLYRQNDMLLSIMLQKQNIFDKTNLLQFAKSIPAYSKTNLTGKDMNNLYDLAKSIDPGNIYFDVLPGMYEYIDNIPYYIPEYSEMEAYIANHIYKPKNNMAAYEELTPQRFSSMIFANGEFTDKQPLLQRDEEITCEEYGIPKDIVIGSIFNRTNMGAAADEVDVIKTKDTALVMEKLQEHIDKQVDKFKSDPHEHEKLNDAVLTTYGDIVIFAVSENSEAVRRTIASITTE